jgi:hypothetical protein
MTDSRKSLVLSLRPGEGVEVEGPVRVVFAGFDGSAGTIVFKAEAKVGIHRDGAVKRESN